MARSEYLELTHNRYCRIILDPTDILPLHNDRLIHRLRRSSFLIAVLILIPTPLCRPVANASSVPESCFPGIYHRMRHLFIIISEAFIMLHEHIIVRRCIA